MKIEKSHIILFVDNQDISTAFYENLLLKKADLNVKGMTEFHVNQQLTIGLMPSLGIDKILDNQLKSPSGINNVAKCELYLLIEDFENEYIRIKNSGVTLISEAQPRDWGHTVAYFSDSDSNIIAIAKYTF